MGPERGQFVLGPPAGPRWVPDERPVIGAAPVRDNRLWWGILLAGLGLCLAAFFIQAHRLRFVCDDAFITFRYAWNLAHGNGLVFNPGERVEGYTSLLWVLLLTPFEALEWNMERVAVALGWSAATATLLLAFTVGVRRAGRPTLYCLLAPALLGGSRIFCGWASGGLETALFGLLLLAAPALAAREADRGEPPVASSLCFVALTLTRPEGFMAWAICAGLVFIHQRRLTYSLLGAALVALPLLAHLGFRLAYYGDPLPNTYYAKVGGFLWASGLGYIGQWMKVYGGYLALPLALLAGFGPARTARPLLPRMLLGIVIVNLLYLAAVGGDFYEFRFIVPLLAPLALLVQEALAAMLVRPGWRLAVLPMAVLILALNLRPAYAGYTPPPGNRAPDGNIEKERYVLNNQWRPIAAWLRTYARPGERIALGAVGLIPYYTRLYTVDVHGLTDRDIARGPVANPGLIGHLRQANREYLLNTRRVTYLLYLRPTPLETDLSICAALSSGQPLCFETTLPRAELVERLRRRGARVVWPPEKIRPLAAPGQSSPTARQHGGETP